MEYYINKEQFETLTAAWKAREQHGAWEHIIYNVLRSKTADLGFTKRETNIQGNDPWHGFNSALSSARYQLKYSNFEFYFGIEKPADLDEKLKGLTK